MDDFGALLSELETMFKALPVADDKKGEKAEDKKIEAAAAEGGEKTDDEKAAEAAAAAEGAEMAKSFKLKLEDGTELDAVDGTEMLKSLMARAKRGETALAKFSAILSARGDMIKSLQGDVATLGASGRGAKAREMAKSAPGDVSPDEFFAKALTAQAAGKLSGDDIARAESHLNRGLSVPTDIVARVYGDSK